VPIGVRVADGDLTAPTGVFLAAVFETGVILGVTDDEFALFVAVGRGFFVPNGVRVGVALVGVVVFVAVDVLLSFAGAFLIGVGVPLVADGTFVVAGVVFLIGVAFCVVAVFVGVVNFLVPVLVAP
jgi:hypothetical protein